MAFGLAQGVYDLAAILDPENVTSAAAETKLRVPFGSPVFQTVAGTSSCPWQPDLSHSACGRHAGAARSGATCRRSSIGRDRARQRGPEQARRVLALPRQREREQRDAALRAPLASTSATPTAPSSRSTARRSTRASSSRSLPGKQIEATLSVERGPTRFRYDILQVILYPECAGPARDAFRSGRAPCRRSRCASSRSPARSRSTRRPRFDLDFGALAEAALGDSLALADFTLETIDYGAARRRTTDDVFLTEIGIEYRPAGSAVWTNAFAATRAQIIAASPQGASATTYYTRWKPKSERCGRGLRVPRLHPLDRRRTHRRRLLRRSPSGPHRPQGAARLRHASARQRGALASAATCA